MNHSSFQSLAMLLVLAFSQYLLVMIAVCCDLFCGAWWALKRGELRRSAAFRRTVDKLARYYNALFALSVIDVMQILSLNYLHFYSIALDLPLMPVFTILGAIAMAIIELKSIFEKADRKYRSELRQAVDIIRKALDRRDIKSFFNEQ